MMEFHCIFFYKNTSGVVSNAFVEVLPIPQLLMQVLDLLAEEGDNVVNILLSLFVFVSSCPYQC